MTCRKVCRNLAILWCLPLFWLGGCTSAKLRPENATPATKVLTQFYEKYLNDFRTSQKTSEIWIFSQDLQELIAENQAVCQQSPTGDICGNASDAEILIAAKDAGERLNFANSQFKASEIGPGLYRVEFDLVPPERSHYHHRRMDFKMILEDGRWVVDDIIDSAGTLRDRLIREIQEVRRASP